MKIKLVVKVSYRLILIVRDIARWIEGLEWHPRAKCGLITLSSTICAWAIICSCSSKRIWPLLLLAGCIVLMLSTCWRVRGLTITYRIFASVYLMLQHLLSLHVVLIHSGHARSIRRNLTNHRKCLWIYSSSLFVFI